MTVKFAFDTFHDLVHGNKERRIQALLTFGLWFCAGAFTVSTFQYYFLPHESAATAAIGGFLVSSVVAATKLS